MPARTTSALDAATDRLDARLAVAWRHRLVTTRHAFAAGNPALRKACASDGPPVAVAVFLDDGLAAARPELPEQIGAWLVTQLAGVRGAEAGVQLLPGGEACKNDPAALEHVLDCMHERRLCRRSLVLAVGGGAILDLVGFAAAMVHRGVPLVRVPSTTLAQGDSGIGVKNGVNRFGVKNFLGAFAVPQAVVNDVTLLESLADRDWRAGFSEAVKVAALKDAGEFARIAHCAERLRARDLDAALPVLARSAALHFEHIATGGDPFERGAARPLDFGHWSAHRLEALSGYTLRHGEAVAIGVALDAQYAAAAGLLAADEADAVQRCLERIGLATWNDWLGDIDALWPGLEQFREHLGGELTISLPAGLGRVREVHVYERSLLERASERVRRVSRADGGGTPQPQPGESVSERGKTPT